MASDLAGDAHGVQQRLRRGAAGAAIKVGGDSVWRGGHGSQSIQGGSQQDRIMTIRTRRADMQGNAGCIRQCRPVEPLFIPIDGASAHRMALS